MECELITGNLMVGKQNSVNYSHRINEGKSVSSFCRQVAAWVLEMFCNFYLVKNCKIANNWTATIAREKSTYMESLEFQKNFDVVWLNLKTIEFYLIKLATDF
jgi:hypothetical protein